jgi:hexosaminidase
LSTNYTNLSALVAFEKLPEIKSQIISKQANHNSHYSKKLVKFLSFKFVFLLFVYTPFFLFAQNINIIPLPKSFVKTRGTFALNGNTIIGMNNDSLLPLANYLQTELQNANGLAIAVDQNEIKALIDLQLVKKDEVPGAYTLKIESNKITIISSGHEGVFYGIVSLLQMIRNFPPDNLVNLPAGEIIDAPRYQWRGFMLDESRHFFGKEKVKQLLNWMAFYKLNKFHWHLTDVNGWRIEIKKYPNLTLVGGVGNHSDSLAEAKYYTQNDIKEIVDYARDRFITVIPEIDMPGHATAANKAYPEFSGGSIGKYPNFTFDPSNEKTYQFLTDILRETNTLFPSQMIHLGGDEVALGIQAWAGRPSIMDMMAKNKFTSLSDLEHYFFRRMADTVISLNSKILCWDEATETDLPADKTIIFWWRQNIPWSLKLALQKKYQVVLCPRLPLYFDFVQDKKHLSGRRWTGSLFNSVSDVYNFPDKQLSADELQSNQILGIQANLWTETVGSEKRLDYMIFPRIAALSEAAWTDSASKNENSFNERLTSNFRLYDKDGIYYYNPFDPSMHPEAIDFAPVIKSVNKNRQHHGRKSNLHHHHRENGYLKHATKQHHSKAKKKHNR